MSKSSQSRYLLVLISCCLMAASSVGVFTNSVGVFYSKVSSDLGVGRGSFAFHATLCSLVMGFLCPVAAKLMKCFRFRPLMIIGSLLSAGATALMAFSNNVWMFYLLGAVRGIGMTTFSLMAVTTLINNWFKEKHGLAVGIALSFSGLAGAIFNPLFSAIISGTSWRAAFLWMGIIGFVLTLPGMLFLEFRPEQAGLLPYGSDTSRPTAQSLKNSSIPGPVIYIPALVVLSLMTLLHTSVTGIAQHFPGMSEWMGYKASVGAAMVSAGMIGNIVSKLVIGTLSDRIGPFRSSMCMILINAAALVLLLLLSGSSPILMYGIAFLYGTVYAVGAVGIPLLTRKLFGMENYVSAYAVITIFTSVGSASALTIIGLVYDLTGGYTGAILGGISIDLINLIILFILTRIYKRKLQNA